MRKSHMALSKHQQWIADQLAATGVSQSELGRRIGLAAEKVNRITKGTRRVQPDELEKAEEFFSNLANEPPVDRARPINLTLVPTPISGKARAGSFELIDDFENQDPEEVLVPRDPDYPNARVVVFEVEGNSMNAADPPIPDRSRVSGPAFEDLHGREPLSDGMIVVIQRSTADGQMIEWSVKEVEMLDEGYAFNPNSTDARYRPIRVNTDLQADDGMTIEIIALVTNVTMPVRKRR